MLQILLLEDDPIDIELIQTALQSGGIEASITTVDQQQAFVEAVHTQVPDLILADYVLPAFDGISALAIAKKICPAVPFILVSGVLGEERAIDTLKQGATDYVLKQRLERLVPSAQRALKEVKERRERQQMQEALRRTDDLLQAIVNASPVAIVTLSIDRRVITWNPAAEQIYGWKANEIVDQPLNLVPPEQQEAFNYYFEQVLQQQTFTNLEFKHFRKEGHLIDLNIALAPLHDAAGNAYGAVMTAVDITLRKQVELERFKLLKREQAARAEAEAANRIKDEFLAVLSHELRTPLNAIVGWIKLIKRGTLTPTVLKQALDVIERNAILQTQLIEDLLDISRIIRGKINLIIQPVDLVALIRNTAVTLRPAIEAKSIQLEFALDDQIGTVSGDLNRLQQVLWNLLSNAIKFTPEAGRVWVRLDRIDSQIRVQVQDSGIGISSDFLPHIFEYFRQADGSTTRSQGGLGLGLAISKHLVELHGGTIEAASLGLGQGATFTTMLPLKQAAADQDSLTTPTHNYQLQGVKAVIVEDEADSRDLLTFILEEQGAQVKTATSVQEALALLDQFAPDVLISDIGMPGEDGYALIRKVRELSNSYKRQVPAIALTAYAKEEDRAQATLAGFQKHVAKPLDPLEIIDAIHQLTRSFTLE